MVAPDETLDLGPLPCAELIGRVARQAQHVTDRRPDLDGEVPGGAQPGPAVDQHHHPPDRDPLAALAQVPFQLAG
jgi:hypothetical protein